MNMDERTLKKRLKEAGLSDPLIDAAWPIWWSDDAYGSPSANAELRFTIARKLGLSPKELFHDNVAFVWKDEARFKHLKNETDAEKHALASFGISVARLLSSATKQEFIGYELGSLKLRTSILHSSPFVDLQSLLATCWAIGVPVIHLRVFPLDAKRMHAMAVKAAGRFVILLGRDAQYPAPIAFTLAHELGHIILGHLSSPGAIVDFGDASGDGPSDKEELAADQFALELLTGTSDPLISTSVSRFGAAQLADAVLSKGRELGIEPGTLALCLAYRAHNWSVANGAMSYIYTETKEVWREVNHIALQQLDLTLLRDDTADFISRVMGIHHGQ